MRIQNKGSQTASAAGCHHREYFDADDSNNRSSGAGVIGMMKTDTAIKKRGLKNRLSNIINQKRARIIRDPVRTCWDDLLNGH